jgi:Transcription termination factor nusG
LKEFKEAMMAKEHWYVLKVRSGFAPIVAQKLRRLNLEAAIPRLNSNARQKKQRKNQSTEYVYCRFALKNRPAITDIAGVLDVLGAPHPTPIDARLATQRRRS